MSVANEINVLNLIKAQERTIFLLEMDKGALISTFKNDVRKVQLIAD